MRLSPQDKDEILSIFPSIELSYEKMTHKKVYNSNIILAIPEGQKYFVWFTRHKGEIISLLMKLNNNKIIEINSFNSNFNQDLTQGNGTIFYGTFFKYENKPLFCIEDLIFYKNKNVYYRRFDEKITILYTILKNDIYQPEINHNTVFGLPIMNTNFYDLLKDIQTLPYVVKTIHFRFFQSNPYIYKMKYYKPNPNNKISNNNFNKLNDNTKIFKVVPDIQNDIYHLYKEENGQDVYVDIAFIPNFETSKYMNKLFRNIKENENLDLLEESDDEEEFEDEKIEKFVYLDKSYKMICSFHHKFGKWVPINIVNEN